jgi:glycosyltransferase involved in cell wall biosynthesis
MSISCVIVNYNNAPYLEQAVSSVLGQTQPPDEIIIADDASTDRSAEVIHAIQHQHPFIRTIIRDTNLGVTANRDLAIRDVSTDFFTTLDSDDIFFPKKVEQEALVLNSNPNAIAFSDIHIISRSRK